MAKTETKANWQTIDTATLPAPIAKQYANYKAAYAEMKAERKALEDALLTHFKRAPVAHDLHVPAGKRLAYGYNFGKLSAAVVADDEKPAARSSSGVSASW
jgi:hypothetical protein